MSRAVLRIATRRSPLALWQANFVSHRLQGFHPRLQTELLPLTTSGDQLLAASLRELGGKDLFVKELERALLDGSADIAVHSMKDLPMDLPEGLLLAAVCEREEPRDALLANDWASMAELPAGAIVGSASLRRQCQLRALRPDLEFRDLRGNVDTRLGKLDAGECAAIVLAAAGLKRLDLAARISQYLEPDLCLPAGGQGAVGVECRAADEHAQALLAPLNHPETALCVRAERAMNRRLNGGCRAPIACFAEYAGGLKGDALRLRGLVGDLQSGRILRSELRGDASQAEELGRQLAEALLRQGAEALLRHQD